MEIACFPGSKAEKLTIMPVVDRLKARHDIEHMVIAADAGMLSAANLKASRRRWRGSQALAGVLPEMKNRGVADSAHHGVRRAERPAGVDHERVAGHDSVNVCDPSAALTGSGMRPTGTTGARYPKRSAPSMMLRPSKLPQTGSTSSPNGGVGSIRGCQTAADGLG